MTDEDKPRAAAAQGKHDADLIERLAREAGFRVMDGGRITVWPERGEMPEIEPLVRRLAMLVAEDIANAVEVKALEAFCTESHISQMKANKAAIVAMIRTKFKVMT